MYKDCLQKIQKQLKGDIDDISYPIIGKRSKMDKDSIENNIYNLDFEVIEEELH